MGIFPAATASLAALASLASLAVLPAAADSAYHLDLEAYQDGDLGDVPIQSFHSSGIKAPVYQVNHWDPTKIDHDSPYMFMAGRYGQWGPSIVSSKDLSLVWADQHYDGLAQTARTWDFRGRRVMTSYADGHVRVYDESYKQIYVFAGRGDLSGLTPDSHEAMLTADGHLLMILCPTRDADLSAVGGPKDGKLADCTIQEVDPDTTEVIFEWATTRYFAPEDSEWEYRGEDVWDFCHMNSVEKTREGNYLVSYRHLSTVIMVNGKTKEVIWVMWGKKNMFEDVSGNSTGGAHFAFQHEARVSGLNRITLFDNHRTDGNGFCDDDDDGGCSRGLEIEYDVDAKTVWAVNEWKHPQSLLSASRGGVQRTPSGNVVVAWGQNPMYTEYTADGELVMDIQRGPVKASEHGIFDVIAYRIWKGNWVGKPSWGPNISYVGDGDGGGDHRFYVSWNGATEVARWVLLMSDDAKELDGPGNVYAQSPRNGFETEFRVDKVLRYGRIAALDSEGRIIGSTPAVQTDTGSLIRLSHGVKAVTRAESLSIDSAIPSSAAVSVPTGESSTDSDAGHVIDESGASESDDEAVRHSLPILGALVAGAIAGAVTVLGLLGILRWRRGNRKKQAGRTNESKAAYGLLETDGAEDDDESVLPRTNSNGKYAGPDEAERK
ncbi:Arylsulfotransferase (ASST) [Geosmithia morbida]|uniref:Arylsulfotransferase (ASST) n=1 Tax=Geosmithia morbida TaxID=1094350 RepID=A0A9P4YM99_9HYPO|nr:Arylsulfotransferase (ASST) [Geosmithia morbida]KAF4119588.1 Arylsulfotransferase (ASST) [Geosmithia morbida]